MTIDIIGAGISGLTTAVALQKKGINFRLYDQAKTIQAVGAGIILASNAMQVFEKLELRKEIEEYGNAISKMSITDPQLHTISTIDLRYFEEKYELKNIAIHRGKLQQILASQIEPESLILDSKLIRILENENYKLAFAKEKTIQSEIVIGADGIHSVVRNSLFPKSKIRSAFQICWRGIVDLELPMKYQNELNEAWGKGDRFGFVQIAQNQVYWFALKAFEKNRNEYSVQYLAEYFEGYHPIIQYLIHSTSTKNIHTAIISDLQPIRFWHKKNVCLIGDAAHAMTPNLGQGACQGIKDAYVLSACLENHEPSKAFAKFQNIRRPKAVSLVNKSWTIGKMAHWKNPLAIRIRNQLMRMTPKSIAKNALESIFKL